MNRQAVVILCVPVVGLVVLCPLLAGSISLMLLVPGYKEVTVKIFNYLKVSLDFRLIKILMALFCRTRTPCRSLFHCSASPYCNVILKMGLKESMLPILF